MRASGRGSSWTLRCYLPTCLHLKPLMMPLEGVISVPSPPTPPPSAGSRVFPCWWRDPLQVKVAPPVLKGNSWSLASVKGEPDTKDASPPPSSSVTLSSPFPRRPPSPIFRRSPQRGRGASAAARGKPASGPLRTSSCGRVHGTVSRRGSPARRGGRPAPSLPHASWEVVSDGPGSNPGLALASQMIPSP